MSGHPPAGDSSVGWLDKRGSRWPYKWSPRFFVLLPRRGELAYFHSEHSAEELAVLERPSTPSFSSSSPRRAPPPLACVPACCIDLASGRLVRVSVVQGCALVALLAYIGWRVGRAALFRRAFSCITVTTATAVVPARARGTDNRAAAPSLATVVIIS